MKAIQVLMDEHKNILRMLKIIRSLCIHTFTTHEVYYEGFYQAIDFVRNYADKFHHGKEEDILFEVMSNELGENIKIGPIYGMLTEHDLGRLFIKNLEDALKASEAGHDEAKIDIIANAISYTDLLYRHIEKEDTAIFTFAEEKLMKKSLDKLDKDFEAAKVRLNSDETEAKYVKILENLEGYVSKIKN
ncbi:hemerythrin domain-containing protein [Alkaliphilus peptidifermentans]|uniref:Hemerythrin-like domain-containing protein n=1 Tax=Alkaliphilus peptidifermentans DSM 18978 TaxID=1120976 RepID=A0A1G5I044_9FIRM|nr:hemerythrin domain-containing protein [Alkaliphilus peptidifermentans]SCY68950.1 Hemerythrin-like domain-containing protein [Alkaliphilus peptidifermentans DSM 18978]